MHTILFYVPPIQKTARYVQNIKTCSQHYQTADKHQNLPSGHLTLAFGSDLFGRINKDWL